jgi:hypothetical protein
MAKIQTIGRSLGDIRIRALRAETARAKVFEKNNAIIENSSGL